MFLSFLLITPITGAFSIFLANNLKVTVSKTEKKITGLITSIVNLYNSLIVFILFDSSLNISQFVLLNSRSIHTYDLSLGVEGISIFFVLLITIIMPISVLSNWTSIWNYLETNLIIILLLESLLIAAFIVIDILLFYIFFESILIPLFIFIGIYGSLNKVRASFYLFLYTLFGSLFLLLSILNLQSIAGATHFETAFKIFLYPEAQTFVFIGIFIAFAIKTPLYFVNIWLLKAHVESPLSGSIILAAIVLKLSLYGIYRLILPILPIVTLSLTPLVFTLSVVSIILASISTLRTTDIKELIAYSSVAHAAVYLLGSFSNSLSGIEGSILLGLGHGLVSSGLFICAGGVLYDRAHTRFISYYRGVAQVMPVFSIIFFILCLGNAGTPLTLNFVGEFLSLYGTFERLPLLGALASSSIVFSAGYTMFMFNRIVFGGSLSPYFRVSLPDLNRREFYLMLPLVGLTLLFGIYPSVILDVLHYSVSSLIYSHGDFICLAFLPLLKIFNAKKSSKKFFFYSTNSKYLSSNIFYFSSSKYSDFIQWFAGFESADLSIRITPGWLLILGYCFPNLEQLAYGASNLIYYSDSTGYMLMFLPFSLLNKLNTLANGAKASSLFSPTVRRFIGIALNRISSDNINKLIVLVEKWMDKKTVNTRYRNLYLKLKIIPLICKIVKIISVVKNKLSTNFLLIRIVNYIEASYNTIYIILNLIFLIISLYFPELIPESLNTYIYMIQELFFTYVITSILNGRSDNRVLNLKNLFSLSITLLVAIITTGTLDLLLILFYVSVFIFHSIYLIPSLIISLNNHYKNKELKDKNPIFYYIGIIIFSVLLLLSIYEILLCLELLIGVLKGVLKMYQGSGWGNSSGGVSPNSVTPGGGTPGPGGGGGGPNAWGPHPDPNPRGRRDHSVRNDNLEDQPVPQNPEKGVNPGFYAPLSPTPYQANPNSSQFYPTTYPVVPTSYQVNPTPYQVGPTPYQANPSSSQFYPTTYPVDPTSYQVGPTPYQANPSSSQFYPTTYPVVPASYHMDSTPYQVGPTPYQANPSSSQFYPTTYPVVPTSYQVDPTTYPVEPTPYQAGPNPYQANPNSSQFYPTTYPVGSTPYPEGSTPYQADPTSTQRGTTPPRWSPNPFQVGPTPTQRGTTPPRWSPNPFQVGPTPTQRGTTPPRWSPNPFQVGPTTTQWGPPGYGPALSSNAVRFLEKVRNLESQELYRRSLEGNTSRSVKFTNIGIRISIREGGSSLDDLAIKELHRAKPGLFSTRGNTPVSRVVKCFSES